MAILITFLYLCIKILKSKRNVFPFFCMKLVNEWKKKIYVLLIRTIVENLLFIRVFDSCWSRFQFVLALKRDIHFFFILVNEIIFCCPTDEYNHSIMHCKHNSLSLFEWNVLNKMLFYIKRIFNSDYRFAY